MRNYFFINFFVVFCRQKLRKAPVLLEKLGRGLRPDSRNAFDIVGIVANKRFIIGDRFRIETVSLLDRLRVINSCFAYSFLRHAHGNFFIHELQGIQVPGKDRGFGFFFFAELFREGGDKIIRLIARLFKNLYSEEWEKIMYLDQLRN